MRARVLTMFSLLLAGCPPSDSQPSIDQHREPTAEEIDDAEYEAMGCLGAYEYDFRRNCRYRTMAICDVERYYGCQPGSERNAYDLDGTCWHFNHCVPDANLWQVTGTDVCDHDRTEIGFCPEVDVACEKRETRAQCEAADGCKAAFAYQLNAGQTCFTASAEPAYIGCVPDEPACDAYAIDHYGEDCVARNICGRTPECEPEETRDGLMIPCEPCPSNRDIKRCGGIDEPDAGVDAGANFTAQLRAATFTVGGASAPMEVALDAEPGATPDPCVTATLGPLLYRQGSELTATPPPFSSRYELLAAVRNDTTAATCGFAGQPVSVRIASGGTEQTLVAYWPNDVPCAQDTWVSVVVEEAEAALDYVQLSLVDSCGTGGGTVDLP